MGRHKRIYTQQEIETAVDLVRKGGTYEDVSRRMEVIFHKKFSPSQLNVQVRQAQGLIPTETPAPILNRFTPPLRRRLPDFSVREQRLMPDSVTVKIEASKEDPVTEFLNHLALTDELQYVNESSLPFPTPPRIEDFADMISSAVNNVIDSMPVIAVDSWKSRMMNLMWRKFNPLTNESEFPDENKMAQENEILELKRRWEESQKEDKNTTSLGNPNRAVELGKFVGSPDNGPIKSVDGLVNLSATSLQSTAAINHAELSEQKKSETKIGESTESPVVESLPLGPDADALSPSPKALEPPIEFETEGLLKPDAKAVVMTSQRSPPIAILTAESPPIEALSVPPDSSGETQLLHGTSKPVSVILAQSPTIETLVAPDPKGVSQSFNGASNPQIVDHSVQPSITQDTCSPVQPTIIQANPSIPMEVKEVKPEIIESETSFRQTEPGAIPNGNGNILQKASWIMVGVGILGLAIYVFNPQLRRWVFPHFPRFIPASKPPAQKVVVPTQSHAASQPAKTPNLYSVQTSQPSLQTAEGYSRVNDPNGPATF